MAQLPSLPLSAVETVLPFRFTTGKAKDDPIYYTAFDFSGCPKTLDVLRSGLVDFSIPSSIGRFLECEYPTNSSQVSLVVFEGEPRGDDLGEIGLSSITKCADTIWMLRFLQL